MHDSVTGVRSAGGITMQYDDNGNMTRKVSGGVTLDIVYNYDNMPELVKKNSSNYVRFTYDGNGERVKKENLWTGSTTLYFGDAYEVRGSVGIMHLFGAGGQRVVSIRSDGAEQCYHPNHLGSASAITDANGNLLETIEYFPFGTYRGGNQNPSVNYTFTDQEDDDDLGLYTYNARLYDPVLGRFLSADTIVPNPYDLQSLNRYSYVLNDPLSLIDPSGHFYEDEPNVEDGEDPYRPSSPEWVWQLLIGNSGENPMTPSAVLKNLADIIASYYKNAVENIFYPNATNDFRPRNTSESSPVIIINGKNILSNNPSLPKPDAGYIDVGGSVLIPTTIGGIGLAYGQVTDLDTFQQSYYFGPSWGNPGSSIAIYDYRADIAYGLNVTLEVGAGPAIQGTLSSDGVSGGAGVVLPPNISVSIIYIIY